MGKEQMPEETLRTMSPEEAEVEKKLNESMKEYVNNRGVGSKEEQMERLQKVRENLDELNEKFPEEKE